MKNKFLFVVVCMFLLVGALAPIVSAQDKLQMWRNSSSGVTPQAYFEKSSEKISTESNVSWAAPRAYTNQVGLREEVREPSKEGPEIFLEKIFTINNNGNWYMMGDFNLSGSVIVGDYNLAGEEVAVNNNEIINDEDEKSKAEVISLSERITLVTHQYNILNSPELQFDEEQKLFKSFCLFSIAETCPDSVTVTHQVDTLGSPELLGSNPSQGVSAFSFGGGEE